jgi:hypothetical protein
MNSETPVSGGAARRAGPGGWNAAVLLCCAGIVPLCWLLARLIWLPLYMGLFFFIIAGLLVGASSFRLASRSRPIQRPRIILGSLLVAIVGGAAFLTFEYFHFARTVGEAPHFAEAKNTALQSGRTARSVEAAAAAEFQRELGTHYAPGGPLGYIRWAISSAAMPLVVDSSRESIVLPHTGVRWIVRTISAVLLLGLGVFLSFDALRSGNRVTNILQPGEPFEEEF